MTILKAHKKSDTQKKKVVGAYLPQSLVEYLTLYMLAHGKSNRALIEELLTEWKETTNFPTSYFIDTIVTRVLKEWDALKERNKAQSFKTFLESLKNELRTKGVKDEHIKTISKMITNATKKED